MIDHNEIASILSLEKLLSEIGIDELDSDEFAIIYNQTPAPLRNIAHYAFIWGVGDDIERSALIERAPERIRKNLKWVVNQHDDDLDAWLAGPEATCANPTKAYLAFSNMRMGSDEIL